MMEGRARRADRNVAIALAVAALVGCGADEPARAVEDAGGAGLDAAVADVDIADASSAPSDPLDAETDALFDASDAAAIDVADDSGDAAGAAGLDAILAAIRADVDGTLTRVAADTGWPAPVDGGWLFVTADPDLTHVLGDFDGWAGQRLVDDLGFRWHHTASLDPTGYKFRGVGEPVQDPWSRQYIDDAFGRLSLAGWTGPRLERWFDVEGERPGRTVRVWHPGVAWTHTLYVHDGQNVFDPTAPWGGWDLRAAIEDAPVLVVAIDNTGTGRMQEYTHVADRIGGTETGGLGAAYGAYVADTVRPLVDAHYGEVGPVGVMGSSLGGLVSLNLALDDPDAWDFAASLSGTIGWGSREVDGDTILARWAEAGRVDVAVYIDSGGGASTCVDTDGDGVDDDGDGTDNYCETVQLRDQLDALGYTFGETLWHWHEPGAPHNEAAWADRVDRPIGLFLDL